MIYADGDDIPRASVADQIAWETLDDDTKKTYLRAVKDSGLVAPSVLCHCDLDESRDLIIKAIQPKLTEIARLLEDVPFGSKWRDVLALVEGITEAME